MLNYLIKNKMKKKQYLNNNLSLKKSSLTKRLYCSLILAGLASVPALAQNASATESIQKENKVYTLDECINEAVKNNLALRNADNQIAMSAEQRKEAYTKYFPTLSASGGGFVANKGLVQMDMGGMGLSLAKNGLMAGVTAMQPVFAGGQIVNGNKLAKVGENVSRLQRNMSENDIRLHTEQYYWNIVMLKEKKCSSDRTRSRLRGFKWRTPRRP